MNETGETGRKNKHSSMRRPEYVMYLAVLPKYRSECIRLVRQHFKQRLALVVSSAHLDSTVKTGVPSDWVYEAAMLRVRNKAFVQLGHFRWAISARLTVVDLNPRSITAWAILLIRRTLRRPTLAWGHIHPKAGAGSRSAKLRLAMRRCADATISYTYLDKSKAEADLPGQNVYVAPNAVYLADRIQPASSVNAIDRTRAIYVGRLEPAKKPMLMLEALAAALPINSAIGLTIIGSGSEYEELRQRSLELGIEKNVEFIGWNDDAEYLGQKYGESFCSLSPGFAGLGLTQSLGFGVPMLVAAQENHSPEIELAEIGGVTYFESDDRTSLAEAMLTAFAHRDSVPNTSWSSYVRSHYSAEAMSRGLINAMEREAK